MSTSEEPVVETGPVVETEPVVETQAVVETEAGSEIQTEAESPDIIEDLTEEETVTAPAAPVGGFMNWVRAIRVTAIAAGLAAASLIAAASVYWFVYRPDRLTDEAAQQQVLAAAKEGTEAILSYSPQNLDQDLANAKSHLTG
ncbi:MAG: hypothetical protein ACR2JM_07715, partial [Mycobacterium sp.]